jgi:hypothetical protein
VNVGYTKEPVKENINIEVKQINEYPEDMNNDYKEKLLNKYNRYEYTITNASEKDISINQVQVKRGTVENILYSNEAFDYKVSKASYIPFIGGFAAVGSIKKNQKKMNEKLALIQKVNQNYIFPKILPENSEYTFVVFTKKDKNINPEVVFTFQNLKTYDYFNITK